MNKEKIKAIIEWSLAILLIFIVIKESPYISYYKLSPEAAFERSERTYYYGPSEVVENVELDDVQIFLSKYKDWFSATLVNKYAGIFWGPGSGVGGLEIKEDQDITHSWGGTSINEDYMLWRYYGIVTNPEISKVELDVAEGYGWDEQIPVEDIVTLDYQLKDHRMFLFHWNKVEDNYLSIALRGLNSDGEVIYKEDVR
ncbi:hypothetical protein GCM10011351_25620 [Paraliobacillus quinghaiensis]|uniref:DUF5044 domain-containing protein n=1 Tax=Paraliobacillus quinghaiensis TaxID=470815 RepID=A0A917TU58_9BACI|nr:DUF5044 domain-containing protein [Paraliobacillus quinghaiensis]GGM38391.1 hypothetical protein GCM10011351_25620 [Paraliobacillus quinghaiensis]